MMKKLLIAMTVLLLNICSFAQSTMLTLPTADATSSFNVTDNASTPKTLLNLNGDAGFYLGGIFGTGTIPTTGGGTRMMWYPAKGAFRAGGVSGTEWDDANVGQYSIALGFRNTASAYGTTALGFAVTASQQYSFAMGYGTTASGKYSTAIGNSTTASGEDSYSMGTGTTASGEGSTSMGNSTTASNSYSVAMGVQTLASGVAATTMGQKTTAQAFASLVIGRFNVISGAANSWVSTEPLFVCGNGSSSSSTSNALTLLKDGNMTIAGTLTQNSDIRLKKNITPLTNTLQSIERITPIYYNFKDTLSHPAGRQIGFSAQEIEKEFPELVTKDSKGYLSVEYANMTAVLLQAIKELQKQNSEFKAIVAEQNEKIAWLEKKLKK
jgi:hypothetical protein